MKDRIRVLTIVGTRPEAIKLAPVIKRLYDYPEIEQKVVLSGQHRELLYSALATFGIRADVDLGLMKVNQSLSQLTAKALAAFDTLYLSWRPNWLVVQGDTTTAFTATLAAYYRRIRVAHVEAGLRTGNPYDPFPEEVNRCFIDQLSSLHFAPTERARQNLYCGGVDPQSIFVTGNTSIDALLEVAARTQPLPSFIASARDNNRRVLLVTAHRRESFGLPLTNICQALCRLVQRNLDLEVVYSVHPNPNVSEPVRALLNTVERIHVVNAQDYESFVGLMKACELILTDSGGIQEEAPSLKKPVLVLRNTTERIEGIEAGTALLVGVETDRIVSMTERVLRDREEYEGMLQMQNPYGDGHAAERIVEAIARNRETRTWLTLKRQARSPRADSPLSLREASTRIKRQVKRFGAETLR